VSEVSEGTVVAGQYEVGEIIRQDAVSSLCAAQDLKNNRKVWVKLASPELAADEKFVEQFRQEAKILAELKSSQIPLVLDAGGGGDTYYIVLEPATGKTLAALLRDEGSLAVGLALKIAEQVACCLHVLAQKDLVHRAVNPANILITPAGDVVIIDFGLMRASSASEMSSTEVSATPDYISPELIEGGRSVDIRSDIYALGVILYTMLAGKTPFRGKSAMDTIRKHLSAPIPSLCAVRPDTPPEVDAIVARCLAKVPGDRYQTPAELIDAIRDAMELLPAESAAVAAPPAQEGKAAPPPSLHIPNLRCPHCGQLAPATEKLCPRCGRPMAAATPPPPSGAAPLTPARLVICAGPERGKTFVVETEARVGRGEGNDIALNDPQASRHHSQITRHGSQYILVDLGSSNGTLVNNRRIEGGYVLKEGDVVKVGKTEMVFHY
jgi:hypothetical protein